MAQNNTEVEKVAINDIGTVDDFIKAVDSTIKNFSDGDLVEGTVVKVDRDEVLLDIGYKTEVSFPLVSFPSRRTLIRMRSSRSATPSKPLSSPRKTRKDV